MSREHTEIDPGCLVDWIGLEHPTYNLENLCAHATQLAVTIIIVRGGLRPGVGHLGLMGGPLALKPSGGLRDGLPIGRASIHHGGLESRRIVGETCGSAKVSQKNNYNKTRTDVSQFGIAFSRL